MEEAQQLIAAGYGDKEELEQVGTDRAFWGDFQFCNNAEQFASLVKIMENVAVSYTHLTLPTKA